MRKSVTMNHTKCKCGHSKHKHYFGLHGCDSPCKCMEFVQRDPAQECADALLPAARAAVNLKREMMEGK